MVKLLSVLILIFIFFLAACSTTKIVIVKESLSPNVIKEVPSTNDPLSISPSALVMQPGDFKNIAVTFMNPNNVSMNCSLTILDNSKNICASGISCPKAGGPFLLYSKSNYEMKPSQINMWSISVDADPLYGVIISGNVLTFQVSCADELGLLNRSYSKTLVVTVDNFRTTDEVQQ